MYRGCVYVPKDPQLCHDIVHAHHDSMMTSHPGKWKTLELVSCNYWWPGISCYVAGNIAGDARPPVIAGDQLQCLPLPWVAGHHGVMVDMDNVMAELWVFWDIHASPVHDQVSVSLPLV